MDKRNFYNETLYDDFGQRFRIDRVLFESGTGIQHLVIFENSAMGKIMALDGVIQTTTADEFVYHEMLTHVPIMAHGAAKKILIIGGGDGGMLRRCLEHKSVEKITMVEIDRSVVDMSIQWLPEISAGAFDDPRADLVIEDGCKFVKETKDKYDVIIVDSTDPVGPGAVLFTSEFYTDCHACLASGGVIVTQNGVPFFQPDELFNTHKRLKPIFKDAWFYVAPVPTYYGGFMAFGWASDNVALRRQPEEAIAKRFAAAGLATRYYNAGIHAGAFGLPQFMLDTMEGKQG